VNFAWCVICDVTAFFFLTEDFRGRFWQLVLYPLLVPKAFFLRHLLHPKTRKKEETKSNNRLFHHRRREREFLIFFGKRALKFTPEARKPHTRTRNTDNKNVFRSFLLCWHQSRRQDERPRLCFLEKSVGASLRRKKTLVRVLVLIFFFCKSALFERARG
jgi:hypothetical protein